MVPSDVLTSIHLLNPVSLKVFNPLFVGRTTTSNMTSMVTLDFMLIGGPYQLGVGWGWPFQLVSISLMFNRAVGEIALQWLWATKAGLRPLPPLIWAVQKSHSLKSPLLRLAANIFRYSISSLCVLFSHCKHPFLAPFPTHPWPGTTSWTAVCVCMYTNESRKDVC